MHGIDTDPDPEKLCGSDSIPIRIHNTGMYVRRNFVWRLSTILKQ